MNLDATISVTNQTIKLKINSADLKILEITDTTIGAVSPKLFNALVSTFKGIVIGVINLITNTEGLDLNKLLNKLGLTFIELGPTTLTPFDEYFLFYTTPIFTMENFDPTWA
jgi:hypothetical protein